MNPLDVLHFEPDHMVYIDFETYYDPKTKYSLMAMPPVEYIRDERFEVIGVGVQVDDEPGEWLEEWEFAAFARGFDWSKVTVVGHNLGGFDALIMAYKYGIRAGAWVDTLPMARAKHGTTIGNSLKKLMDYYQIGQKGDEVVRAQGKRRKDFTPAEYEAYGKYCLGDVGGTRDLVPLLTDGTPELELWKIDTTIRMATEPKFVLNEPFLEEYLVYERKRKADLMRAIAGLPETAPDVEVATKVKPVLMSNEKFARLLIALGVVPPRKISVAKTKLAGEPVLGWAFAKSDPGMQELLDHANDDIRMVAEARVGVKSTINETRTVRMLKLGRRGQRLPVMLNHCAAHTGRDGGAGKMNWQNFSRVLKPPKGVEPAEKHIRSGALRKAVEAEPGSKIVVVDSAAVEARGTAWLAEHASLIAEFATNKDVYSRFASMVFGRPVSKKDVMERALGKVCLGGGTKVLTPRGWVPIVEVRIDDQVWDGVEWVSHRGLADQGVREVWTSDSVSATPDHKFLTQSGWRAWSTVLTSPSLYRSVLSSASSPSSTGSVGWAPTESPAGGVRLSDVHAGGREAWTDTRSSPEGRSSVGRADEQRFVGAPPRTEGRFAGPRSRSHFPLGTSPAVSRWCDGLQERTRAVSLLAGILSSGASAVGRAWSIARILFWGALLDVMRALISPQEQSAGGSTREHWRTTRIEPGFLTVSLRVFLGAATLRMRAIGTMAAEAFASMLDGALIELRFSPTFRLCLVGTSPSLISIAPTLTAATSPGTFGSSHALSTRGTSGKSERCRNVSEISKERMPTYDLLSAGPRHRFTILSAHGPMTVSNCTLGLGYAMGWLHFAMVLAAGPMGNDPIIFTMKEAEEIGVDVAAFKRDAKKMARVEDIPSRLPLNERAVHCAVCEHVVRLYRQENGPITELWETMDGVLEAMMDEEEFSFGPGGAFTTERHAIRLPSGRMLRYPGLEEDDGAFSYLGDYRQRTHLYGGKLVENTVQAFCRDIVVEQMMMIRGQLGLLPQLFAHDELVYVVPEDKAQFTLDAVTSFMKKAPDWAQGMPVSAEGGFANSYGLAK